MTGDPPIGTEDAFPKDDPGETAEERRARLAGQTGTPGVAPVTPGVTADANARADAVVRRESGVTDFSAAGEEDRAGTYQVEDYPGQDDPTSAAGMNRDDPTDDSPGEVASRGINNFIRAAETLGDDDDADRDRRSRP